MTLQTMLGQLAQGMVVTTEIFALTLVFSLPLGLLVALARCSKLAPVRLLMQGYISIMRGTPLVLQLLVVYFGPFYLFGMRLSGGYRFVAVILAFSLNYAAYFGEIFRGGIESISRGQRDAAQVLGYRKGQAFWRILLPQVVKRVLPSVTNEVITLVKDTSLAFAISVAEMFTAAKAIAAAQKSMASFVAAGIFYYVFNLIVALCMDRAERGLAYYR